MWKRPRRSNRAAMNRIGRVRNRTTWFAAISSLAIALAPALALADTVVLVEVRGADGASEAEVMLRDADGVVHRCQTEQGRCRMEDVAAGRYTLSARDAEGRTTPGRPVMIPGDGEVTLIVAAPSE